MPPTGPDPMQPLNGKVVLVTGAARGLGAAVCRTLARAQAHVIVADVRGEAAEECAASLGATGARAFPLALDVTDSENVARGIEAAVRHYGKLDAVINNAGTDVTSSLAELSIADWDKVLRTNLSGPFYVAKAALPHLRKSGDAHVVNIVSTAARRAWPNASAYHASKYGLLGLSHALHAELRSHGIKVTAIVAGGMRTPFLLDRFPDIPLENLQEPENVAEAVRFALMQPQGSVVAELMILPMKETSWP
jgi:NAD(P)-dependent dehydrogenase (short-subunit alcohol dehydrogenase family)